MRRILVLLLAALLLALLAVPPSAGAQSLKFLGGAGYVDKMVALAPSNHGTTLDGFTALVDAFGAAGVVNSALNPLCTACVEQEAGSAFLASLNAGGETVAGVGYTVIESRYDEVVTPYTSAFLPFRGCRSGVAVPGSPFCPVSRAGAGAARRAGGSPGPGARRIRRRRG